MVLIQEEGNKMETVSLISLAISIVLMTQAFFIGRKQKDTPLWKYFPYLVFFTGGLIAGSIGSLILESKGAPLVWFITLIFLILTIPFGIFLL